METVREDLFGKDPRIQKAIEIAKNLSVVKSPILISGESGVGKRTLGRFIHENSNRSSGSLIFVDCMMDPKDVENSILGYRNEGEGKFYKGALEDGNGGTVIFSNIDSLEENFQRRVCTILNDLMDYDLDVRIISTTTKNLSKMVGSARFYKSLYEFISPNFIFIPPLRERIGDLESVAKHFASQANNGNDVEITEEAMNKILSHYWIHNIEELKEVMESSISTVEGGRVSDINLEVGGKKSQETSITGGGGIRLMSLKEAERLLIKKALIHTSENRTQAAKILGVSIRTLRNKINEYRNSGSSYFIDLK